MATLTLEPEQTPYSWTAVEQKLSSLFADFTPVLQEETKRAYQVNLHDQKQPILFLQELQSLLSGEDINFTIDLNP